MLRILGLMGVSLLLSAAVGAPPAALEPVFSGTMIATYPDGRVARYWLNRDGTYTAEGRRHGRYKGHWSLKGGEVCFRQGLGHYCSKAPTRAAFTTKALDGETVQVRLTPGRAGEAGG